MKSKLLFLILVGFFFASCSEVSQPAVENPKSSNPMNDINPSVSDTGPSKPHIYPELKAYMEACMAGKDRISEERKALLQDLAQYIRADLGTGKYAQLTFFCTHNSRRSHMSQIWAATAAAYYGFGEKIDTYSGGTEATAFNPRAVAALERAGFRIEKPVGYNPKYKVHFGDAFPAMIAYSKTYDDPVNPSADFIAVMTCSDADENCPFIPGASRRVPLTYIDPKEADGTGREAEAYDERCRQIATEMLYLLGLVVGS